jgi:hypothetical protein
MGKSIAKVVYKPDPNASDVFIVIVNHPEVRISARATESSTHAAPSSLNGRVEVIILALHHRLNH